MAGRVCKDAQGFFGVSGAILEQAGSERQGSAALLVESSGVMNAEVQVELLRHISGRPGRGRQLGHLLEGESGCTGLVLKHEPFATPRIGLPWRRRFVPEAVAVTEEMAVELG